MCREAGLYFHCLPMGVTSCPSIIINVFILSSLIYNTLSLRSGDKLLHVNPTAHMIQICASKKL